VLLIRTRHAPVYGHNASVATAVGAIYRDRFDAAQKTSLFKGMRLVARRGLRVGDVCVCHDCADQTVSGIRGKGVQKDREQDARCSSSIAGLYTWASWAS
jgi:hypothetical protein